MIKETELIGKEISAELISSYLTALRLPEFRKKYSGYATIMAGVCARILGLEDLVIEFEKHLKSASPEELKTNNSGSKKIMGIEEIDEKYPLF